MDEKKYIFFIVMTLLLLKLLADKAMAELLLHHPEAAVPIL
jgi:hypothetical protein